MTRRSVRLTDRALVVFSAGIGIYRCFLSRATIVGGREESRSASHQPKVPLASVKVSLLRPAQTLRLKAEAVPNMEAGT